MSFYAIILFIFVPFNCHKHKKYVMASVMQIKYPNASYVIRLLFSSNY